MIILITFASDARHSEAPTKPPSAPSLRRPLLAHAHRASECVRVARAHPVCCLPKRPRSNAPSERTATPVCIARVGRVRRTKSFQPATLSSSSRSSTRHATQRALCAPQCTPTDRWPTHTEPSVAVSAGETNEPEQCSDDSHWSLWPSRWPC